MSRCPKSRVLYRRDSNAIERTELVATDALFRPDVVRKLNLPEAPNMTHIKKSRLEEYYGSPWFVVLTNGKEQKHCT